MEVKFRATKENVVFIRAEDNFDMNSHFVYLLMASNNG